MTHVSSRLTMSWCVCDLALSCRYRRMCCSTLSVHIAYTQVFTCMQTARNATTVTMAEHYNLTVRKNMVNPAIEHASSPYELVSQATGISLHSFLHIKISSVISTVDADRKQKYCLGPFLCIVQN